MKKVVLCIMIVAITVLVSCGNNDYNTPDESAREMITNIVICFESKDKETLKSYFSEQMQDRSTLDSEINIAFEFLDGEIVSVGEPNSGCIGPIDDKAFGGHIKNVTTSNGTVYKFDFKGMYRYDKDTSQEGVTGLRIINMSDDYDYDNPNGDISVHRCIVGEYD